MKKIPHEIKERGVVLLISIVFLGIFFTIATAFVGYVVTYAKAERHVVESSQALALAEAGVDKAAYELNQNSSYSGETNTALGAGTFTVTVTPVNSTTKQIAVTASIPNSTSPTTTKTVKVTLGTNPSNVSFHYGIQSGDGGFSLSNTSSVIGNVYSTGSIIGSGANRNTIYGDAISAGSSGLIYGIEATGTAYAHTLGNAGTATTIDKDAYYVTKTNTTVTGTSHPGSPDQASTTLPISDTQITDWETQAAAGGTASCTSGSYSITASSTIGPLKIPCDLNITGSAGGFNVTIAGPIWATGNIDITNKVTVKMLPSLGSQNAAIIADNPSNQTGSGLISVGTNASFQGSGSSGSFVFLISQNKSAEQGGSTVALTLNQGASALVVYAAHGLINLQQSVNVKEVTAYKTALYNSARVTYDSGLPSTVFESGPGGSWNVTSGTYAITQ